MESRATALGHGVHPMLIVFPLGLLAAAVIFDILYLATDRTGFQISAAYTIAAGVIGGLVAALFGLMDLRAIPSGTRAKRVEAAHGLGNVVVVLLFGVVLSFAGILLAGVKAWIGGELVERLGTGVSPNAGVNAPSSLSR